METIGILCGLATAVCSSASYLFSRFFVVQRRDAVIRLLMAAHLIMGFVSLILLPLVWSPDIPPLRQYATPLLGSALFYLAGQGGLFYLVRDSDSSRVAPLLGFKIVILAGITVVFMGQHLNAGQWMAVVLSMAATLALTQSGGKLPLRSIIWLLVTCTAYSLSDLNIAWLVKSLAPLTPIRASLVGVCLTYILCGIVAVALLPVTGCNRVMSDWKHAFPFAIAWLLAMAFLFICFGLIGPVYGNILQSTRGIISVIVGAGLARMGLDQVERKVSHKVLARRIAAAVLMCVAIWLFKR